MSKDDDPAQTDADADKRPPRESHDPRDRREGPVSYRFEDWALI